MDDRVVHRTGRVKNTFYRAVVHVAAMQPGITDLVVNFSALLK